jgi:hypothetical protein
MNVTPGSDSNIMVQGIVLFIIRTLYATLSGDARLYGRSLFLLGGSLLRVDWFAHNIGVATMLLFCMP